MATPKKSSKSINPAKADAAVKEAPAAKDKVVTPPPPSIYIDPSHSASSVAASLAARGKQGGGSPAGAAKGATGNSAANSASFKSSKTV